MVTEGTWTWFGSILLSLFFFSIFNLKYYRKVVSRPKNLEKEENEKVLKDYLLAHQGGLGCQLPTSPISIPDFKLAFQDRQKIPIILKLEFSAGDSVEEDILSSCGRLPANLVKNRNPEIVPYDYNLVQVDGEYMNASLCSGYMNASLSSGYMNASLCSGYMNASLSSGYMNASVCSGHNGFNYIVTQGPLNETISQFWTMIWNEKVGVIAMLTKTFDFIKVMCVEYWPATGEQERYGHLMVRNLSQTRFSNFVVRRFLLSGCEEGAWLDREVVHYQYTEWACHGFPVNETLLDYRRRVAAELESSKLRGPCVVHCNDGGGRSGVYILMDYNIRLIDSEGLVDICSRFSQLRRERMGLIATEDQYHLVYTLVHRYLAGQLNIRSRSEIQQCADTEGLKADLLKDEYLLVCRLVAPLGQGECAAAHRADNRGKNRHYLIVPPDAHRPYITSFQSNNCTDYLNAVFVDGFLKSKEFIVTEWPMNNTLPDFWSMIYDHEVSTLVVLDKMRTSIRYPGFWPEPGKLLNYGPAFSVNRLEGEENTKRSQDSKDFSTLTLEVRRREVVPHKQTQAPCVGENQGRQVPFLSALVAGVAVNARTCKLFKIENWPAGVLGVLLAVTEWRKEIGDTKPVCVISQDGVSRVGVYTLLSYAKDQVEREDQLNILQAAATIKSHRPNLIKNIGEYKLFYSLLSQLLQSPSY